MIPETRTQAAKAPKTTHGGNRRPKRARMIAKIHILAKRAGMDPAGDRETYEQMLVEIGGCKRAFGVVHATGLTDAGLAKVLDHLSRLTGEDSLKPSQADIDGEPQLAKIDALLRDAGRPWGYLLSKGQGGRSLLQRLTGKDRPRFCTAADLGKVIAALEIDAKRRAARAAGGV